MRAFLGLFLALLASAAPAQLVAPVREAFVTNVTGGTLGRLDDNYRGDGLQPAPGNYIWDDEESEWIVGAIPDSLVGLPLVHTSQADADTTGASTVVSFTAVGPSTVLVLYDDSETTPPTWLTDDFDDCGLNVVDDSATFSVWFQDDAGGAVTLGGNCETGGCQADPVMYLAAVAPAWRAICQPEGPSDPGSLQFTSAAYSGDENTQLTFFVERVNGASGPVSVTIAEGANPGNGTLNTTNLSWADGETQTKPGTVNLGEVGSPSDSMTLVLSGSNLGSPTTATLTINDTTVPPTSADVFVNRTDGNCSDSNDGLSQTYVSGTNGPYCTIARGNQAPAGSTVGVVSSTYRNDPINPQNANLTYIPVGGDVTLMGPTSGNMVAAVVCNQPGLEVLSDGGNEWLYDGEYEWGSGLIERGDSPSGGHISQGGDVNAACDGATFQIRGSQTAGWNGWHFEDGVASTRWLVNFDGPHGNPAIAGQASDYGDWLWLNADYPTVFHMDGCSQPDGLTYKFGGHSIGHLQDSRILAGCTYWDNRWFAGVPTWEGSDGGNRTFSLTRNVQRSVFYQLVLNGGGYSADNATVSCAKLEGRQNALVAGVAQNCIELGHNIASAYWSSDAYGGRVYHYVYKNLGSVVANIRQYAGTSGGTNGARSQLRDYRFKNIVVLSFDTDGGNDDLFNLVDADGGCYEAQSDNVCNDTITLQWDDFFQLHGALIYRSTGSCNDVYITASGEGRQNLNYWQANYPALFSNITCSATVGLGYGNRPADGDTTDTYAEFTTHWTPTDDTLTGGQGSDLTQTSSAQTNSTNLCVDDITGFIDPDGADIDDYGQFASFGAWMVNLNGTNVAYSNLAFNGTFPNVTGCFTLVSPATWPDNAPVNYPISSGSSPNLGAIL